MKTTVLPAIVTLSAETLTIEITPAVTRTTAQPIAVVRVGDNQTVVVQPAG
jgi:hypothetical protein